MNNEIKFNSDWAKFFDPDGIKSNLIRCSLFLISYELLKNSIVDKIKDFYSIGFDETGLLYSEDYK